MIDAHWKEKPHNRTPHLMTVYSSDKMVQTANITIFLRLLPLLSFSFFGNYNFMQSTTVYDCFFSAVTGSTFWGNWTFRWTEKKHAIHSTQTRSRSQAQRASQHTTMTSNSDVHLWTANFVFFAHSFPLLLVENLICVIHMVMYLFSLFVHRLFMCALNKKTNNLWFWSVFHLLFCFGFYDCAFKYRAKWPTEMNKYKIKQCDVRIYTFKYGTTALNHKEFFISWTLYCYILHRKLFCTFLSPMFKSNLFIICWFM